MITIAKAYRKEIEAFPEEIDAWLAEDAKITPEYLRANFPQPVRDRRPTGTR